MTKRILKMTPKKAVILTSSIGLVLLTAFFFRTQIYNLATKGADPIAYWTFNEGVGSTANDSAGSNTGTLATGNSAPTWITEDQCISGKCLFFDGTNDLVGIGNVSSLKIATKTISFWARPTASFSNVTPVISNGGANWYAGFYSSDRMFFSYTNNDPIQVTGATANNSVVQNEWHLYTFTFTINDPNVDVSMYIDSKLISTVSNTTGYNSSYGTNFIIGAFNTSSLFFRGYIDEVKIYDYARTAAQIKQDFASRGSVNGVAAQFGDAGAGQSLSNGLVGYWKMDEVGVSGSNWTARDSSGNNNNGTGVGNATVGSTAPGKFGNGGYFDGNGDYVTITDNANLRPNNSSWSMSFWAKPTNTNQSTILAIKLNSGPDLEQYFMGFCGSFDCSTSGQHLTVSLNQSLGSIERASMSVSDDIDGQWHLYTMVADKNADAVLLYMDGAQLSTTTNNSGVWPTVNNTDNLNMGGFSDGGQFTGNLDEFRIYNRALDPSEVKDLYQWAAGPVGWWKFDENTGTATNDSSGNNNNCTFSSMPTAPWVQGKFGTGLDFQKTNDYVSCGSASSVDNLRTLTISAWINPRVSSTYEQIVTKSSDGAPNTGYLFESNMSTNTLEFWAGTSATTVSRISASNVLIDNQWQYVTVTWDGSLTGANIHLYVNGVEVTYGSTTNGSGTRDDDSAQNFLIGNEPSTGDDYDGWIDDVKVYNYIRTSSQIIDDMNAGHPAPGSPVGHAVLDLPFDEGYGSTVHDASPQGNDGTLGAGSSAPAWTNDGKFGKALSFDGTSDYVRVADDASIEGLSAVSISVWVKPTQCQGIIGSSSILVRKTAVYSASIRSDCKMSLYIDNGTGWSNEMISLGTVPTSSWSYLTFIYTGSEYKFYKNAIEIGAGIPSKTGTLNTNTEDLGIGSWLTDMQYSYKGLIDEVKIYPFALTLDQVKIDYNLGKSQVMGALSTGVGGTSPSNSSDRSYCVPGDASTCNAPIGEWKMDMKSGGTAPDTSGNGNQGNLGTGNSAPKWVKGKMGNALSFDGQGDFVSVGDLTALEGVSQATWSYWIKSTQWQTGQIILGKSDLFGTDVSWTITHSSSTLGRLLINIATASNDLATFGYAESILTGSDWKYITVVFDGTLTGNDNRLKLFVNGRPTTLTYGGTIPATLRASSTNATIGGVVGSGAYSLNGFMDDIRIYNYARTPAQIVWEFNRGAPVAYYDMNECTGTAVKDQSPNANGGFNGNTGALTLGAGGVTSAGTCTTSGAWFNGATGKRDASISFDGTDDYVTIADNSSLDFPEGTNFSYSMWVKPATVSTNGTILAKKTGTGAVAGYLTFISNQGKIATYIADGTDSINKFTDVTVSAGQWSYITVVYIDDTSLTMYINGKDGGGTLAGTIANVDDVVNASPLVIGAESDAQVFRNGLIDEVKIYNYALTTAQMKTEMNSGAVRFE
jgi:hypothetical protein